MNKEALGVIETVGMAAAIQAADTCVKSANVELIGYELTKGSGLVTIKISGNVGAVKAAIEAAKVSAAAINKVYATLIIPRPAEKLEGLIESEATVGISREVEENNSAQEENKDKAEDVVNVEEENKDKVEDKANFEEGNKDEEVKDVNAEEKGKDIVEDSGAKEINEDIQRVEESTEESKVVEVDEKNDENFEVEDKTLVSNDSVLESPSSPEAFEKEKVDNDKDETEEVIENNSSLNEHENENDEVCNICHDPACTRKKGQPKTLCINYKGTRR